MADIEFFLHIRSFWQAAGDGVSGISVRACLVAARHTGQWGCQPCEAAVEGTVLSSSRRPFILPLPSLRPRLPTLSSRARHGPPRLVPPSVSPPRPPLLFLSPHSPCHPLALSILPTPSSPSHARGSPLPPSPCPRHRFPALTPSRHRHPLHPPPLRVSPLPWRRLPTLRASRALSSPSHVREGGRHLHLSLHATPTPSLPSHVRLLPCSLSLLASPRPSRHLTALHSHNRSDCSAYCLLTRAAVSSPCSPSIHSSRPLPPYVTISPAQVPSPSPACLALSKARACTTAENRPGTTYAFKCGRDLRFFFGSSPLCGAPSCTYVLLTVSENDASDVGLPRRRAQRTIRRRGQHIL